MNPNKDLETELAWMPLYWDKFLSATTHMDAAEIGAYLLLLAHQWKHGYIPSDEKMIRKIARVTASKLQVVLPKFVALEEGKLHNVVCTEIRKTQDEQYQKTLNSSRAGVEARKKKKAKEILEKATGGTTDGYTDGTTESRKEKEEIISHTHTSEDEKNLEPNENDLTPNQIIDWLKNHEPQVKDHIQRNFSLTENEFSAAVEIFVGEKTSGINQLHKGNDDTLAHFKSWVRLNKKSLTQKPKTKSNNHDTPAPATKIGRLTTNHLQQYLHRRPAAPAPADTSAEGTTQDQPNRT